MSIFKTILSPFIEFNDTEGNKATDQKSTVNNGPAPTPQGRSFVAANTNSAANKARPASGDAGSFEGFFTQLIEEANQKNPLFQGIDLKEFIEAKADLDNIPDESTKIITAFNVLKRTGLTKEKLLSTGQEYIRIIDHELEGIEGAFGQQYKNDVQLKEQQVQSKLNEIQELETQLGKLKEQIGDLSQQIESSKQQLTQNKTQFINAGQAKRAEIQAEMQKINKYL